MLRYSFERGFIYASVNHIRATPLMTVLSEALRTSEYAEWVMTMLFEVTVEIKLSAALYSKILLIGMVASMKYGRESAFHVVSYLFRTIMFLKLARRVNLFSVYGFAKSDPVTVFAYMSVGCGCAPFACLSSQTSTLWKMSPEFALSMSRYDSTAHLSRSSILRTLILRPIRCCDPAP